MLSKIFFKMARDLAIITNKSPPHRRQHQLPHRRLGRSKRSHQQQPKRILQTKHRLVPIRPRRRHFSLRSVQID